MTDVKPGDDRYEIAERRFRASPNEAPTYNAESIHGALNLVETDVAEAVRHGYGPYEVLAAWHARDHGEDPEVAPEEALDRLRYAFSGLPDDLRCKLAAEAERTAWLYFSPDLEHLRIVQRREVEQAEQEQAEEAERQRQRDAEYEERKRQRDEEFAKAREAAEEEQRRAEEEETRRHEESERLRRESEATRRGEATPVP